eukprot:5918303-Amphidinium_carterae.1
MKERQPLLESKCYKIGVANPAIFMNPVSKAKSRQALDELGAALASKYSVREAHKVAIILNRIVHLSLAEDGKKQVVIEPDSRHIQVVLRYAGLRGEKGLTTPGDNARSEDRPHGS